MGSNEMSKVEGETEEARRERLLKALWGNIAREEREWTDGNTPGGRNDSSGDAGAGIVKVSEEMKAEEQGDNGATNCVDDDDDGASRLGETRAHAMTETVEETVGGAPCSEISHAEQTAASQPQPCTVVDREMAAAEEGERQSCDTPGTKVSSSSDFSPRQMSTVHGNGEKEAGPIDPVRTLALEGEGCGFWLGRESSTGEQQGEQEREWKIYKVHDDKLRCSDGDAAYGPEAEETEALEQHTHVPDLQLSGTRSRQVLRETDPSALEPAGPGVTKAEEASSEVSVPEQGVGELSAAVSVKERQGPNYQGGDAACWRDQRHPSYAHTNACEQELTHAHAEEQEQSADALGQLHMQPQRQVEDVGRTQRDNDASMHDNDADTRERINQIALETLAVRKMPRAGADALVQALEQPRASTAGSSTENPPQLGNTGPVRGGGGDVPKVLAMQPLYRQGDSALQMQVPVPLQMQVPAPLQMQVPAPLQMQVPVPLQQSRSGAAQADAGATSEATSAEGGQEDQGGEQGRLGISEAELLASRDKINNLARLLLVRVRNPHVPAAAQNAGDANSLVGHTREVGPSSSSAASRAAATPLPARVESSESSAAATAAASAVASVLEVLQATK